MSTVIYSCKRCKVGRRVDYPIGDRNRGYERIDSNGHYQPASVWIQSAGGGKPTIYGGDVEMGLCPSCGKMMQFGKLKGYVVPDCPCDKRCTGARGHNCECSCGGVNHGSDWQAA